MPSEFGYGLKDSALLIPQAYLHKVVHIIGLPIDLKAETVFFFKESETLIPYFEAFFVKKNKIKNKIKTLNQQILIFFKDALLFLNLKCVFWVKMTCLHLQIILFYNAGPPPERPGEAAECRGDLGALLVQSQSLLGGGRGQADGGRGGPGGQPGGRRH